MKLRARDQVHVSSVRADSLRPGEEFEVGDAVGEELMQRHPGLFERLDEGAEEKAEPAPKNKAAPRGRNKTSDRAPDAADPPVAERGE